MYAMVSLALRAIHLVSRRRRFDRLCSSKLSAFPSMLAERTFIQWISAQLELFTLDNDNILSYLN